MKRSLVAISLIMVLAQNAGFAYAEASAYPQVEQKSFFALVIEKIGSILASFSPDLRDPKSVTGEERLKILEILNKYELFVRTDIDGTTLYLAKEAILEKADEIRKRIEESSISKNQKDKLLSELSALQAHFNMDLVEKPQDKLKPALINFFDSVEALTFGMDETDTLELLEILRIADSNS